MKPAARKQLAGYLQAHHQISQRRACRVIPISRKAVRYPAIRPQRDAELVTRLKALGEQYPRYGYLMLHQLLRSEGLVANRKRTYRLYTELGMRMPLREICPIDLMPPNEQRLPPKIRQSMMKPYADRLQALQEARAVYDALVDAAYDMDRTVPNERLALFDRLWFSNGESGPFVSARRAWWRLEADLESWEQELESETVALCQDVLGVNVGDIVVVESGKRLVRLEIEGLSVYPSDDRIMFIVWGKRFRKDGLPGKRTEHFSIVLEND